MADLWRIELLGGLRAGRASLMVSRFRTQKTGALLGYLAYHERPHPREALAELLWPECGASAARNNLSRAVSSLRRQLEPPGVRGVLLADRLNVQLNPDAFTTDVRDLRAALHAAGRASPSERTRRLEGAVELYRGELLAGYEQDWIAAERRKLEASVLRAARDLVAECRRASDLRRALDHARRAVAIDPLSEEAHADVISLHGALNEPQAALRQFEELSLLLERELGARPSAATLELVRGIRARPAKAAPVERATPSPMAAALPRGTVTFLAVSVETAPDLEPVRATLARHGGHAVRDASSGILAAFTRPSEAIAAALEVPGPARRAVDTGEVVLAEGEYTSAALDRAQRLVRAAPPGRILCSEVTAALLRRNADGATSLVDLGYFRLAGATPAQHVFCVLDRAGEDDEVRLEGAERVLSAPLPLEMDRFFGRDDELARMRSALLPRRARLLTLTGPGGIGKTRLALEAVSQLVEPYRGALWFVSLSELSTADGVPGAIADALGMERGRPDRLMERLGVALGERPSLLLLDGVEALVADGAPIVADLLARAPALTCLATSRRPLGLPGEQELPLLGLPVPVAGAAPRRSRRSRACSFSSSAPAPWLPISR
jgi:DNA-binding SARP family transcriptional activator